MKRLLPPIVLSAISLGILELFQITLPMRYFTNDFYIEAYQTTSSQQHINDEIIIVNISDFTPELIKDQIEIISQYEPAVIALDYYQLKMPEQQSDLINFDNLVLPLIIRGDSAQYSPNYFSTGTHYGSINIYSPSYFEPFITLKNDRHPLLPLKIIELYDSTIYSNVLKRNNDIEIINYIGNIHSFIYLGDLTNIQTIDVLRAIKGKIVLLGYVGVSTPYPSESDSYDAHETPKGTMYGVVLLANIVHTLMGNQIDRMPIQYTFLLLAVLTVLTSLLTKFIYIKFRFSYWVVKLIQVAILLILFIFAAITIHWFNVAIHYQLIASSIIISPEISYWYLRYSS